MLLDFFGGHGHSHDVIDHGHIHENGQKHLHDHNNIELNGNSRVHPNDSHTHVEMDSVKTIYDDTQKKSDESVNSKNLKSKHREFFELFKGTGLIVFLANLIHKAADGLVIGAGIILK
jgi:hypothetical protein